MSDQKISENANDDVRAEVPSKPQPQEHNFAGASLKPVHAGKSLSDIFPRVGKR